MWKNKNILITGGTSGLGLALSKELRGLGANVVSLTRRLPESPVAGVAYVAGDISKKDQIHRIYAEVLTHLNSVDVLIHCASSLGPTPLPLLLDTECEDFSQVLEANLLGPFRLSKLILPAMILGEFGIVVNISSDAAVSAYPRWGAYGVSKAALDHLTRIWQEELAETAVKFLALDPGDMDTPLHSAAVPDADRSSLYRPEDSARLLLQQIENGQFQPVRRSLR